MKKPNFAHGGLVVLFSLTLMIAYQNCAETGMESSTLNSSSLSSAALPEILDGDFETEVSGLVVETPCNVENGSGALDEKSSSCRIVSCNDGYRNESNLCVASTNSCPVLNGNGSTQSDGSCRVSSCNDGFREVENRCDLVRVTPTPTPPVVVPPSPSALFPNEMRFSFTRGQPLQLVFNASAAFSSNVSVSLTVAKITSSASLSARLYTKDALIIGAPAIKFTAAQGQRSASFRIPVDMNQSLRGKTVYELDVESSPAVFPKKVVIVLEPKADDIIAVHEFRHSSSGPSGCFGLTYSGKLLAKEEPNGPNGLCQIGEKIGGSRWKAVNSGPATRVLRMNGHRVHPTLAFSEVLGTGEKVISTYTRNIVKNNQLERKQFKTKRPFIGFTSSYWSLAAVHDDATKFSFGLAMYPLDTSYPNPAAPRFGDVVYNSPVGELKSLAIMDFGDFFVAVDKNNRAHLLEMVNPKAPNGIRLKRTLNLGASHVVQALGDHSRVAILTSNNRVLVQALGPGQVDTALGVIQLPAGKKAVGLKSDSFHLSVLFSDGSSALYEVDPRGRDDDKKFSARSMGTTKSPGFYLRSDEAVYSQTTNTIVKPLFVHGK